MPEDHNVKILQWPKDKAKLEHYFQLDKPCPVSIIFDEKPANVNVGNKKGDSFKVDMNMNLKAVEDIPVCIKICEPICAVSDYTVGIELLGQPLASIRLRGKTKIAHCDDKPPSRPVCVDFAEVNSKREKSPFTYEQLQFGSLDDSGIIQFTTLGEPSGQNKIAIPNEGLRIDFPFPVTNTSLTIVNFGNPVIQVNAFMNAELVSEQSVMIQNKTSEVNIEGNKINSIEIKGGSNEAALVQVCYNRATDSQNSPVIIT
ncbi:hypothetical protein [Mangrovivirga cuniculi]|uniref:Uncharacterized protein n=1 Tax=Mangrovivirga cuniculi TaxID=2715131 RepID=A0A4D7K4L2_9BACT|nr:hypothetical protein [Mangrovivirga cuniculi]QCK15774.1 hypothetical protein DCC35_13980 [Mangrovivirga cuniculi]